MKKLSVEEMAELALSQRKFELSYADGSVRKYFSINDTQHIYLESRRIGGARIAVTELRKGDNPLLPTGPSLGIKMDRWSDSEYLTRAVQYAEKLRTEQINEMIERHGCKNEG